MKGTSYLILVAGPVRGLQGFVYESMAQVVDGRFEEVIFHQTARPKTTLNCGGNSSGGGCICFLICMQKVCIEMRHVCEKRKVHMLYHMLYLHI